MRIKTTPLQRLRKLARRIGREHDEGLRCCLDRAELGNRHLKFAEHLQKETFDLDIGLVGLVDQQNRGALASDCLQKRAGQEELLAKDVVVELRPRSTLILSSLNTKQLLAVVPFIQGTRLVESFVALQADERGSLRLRDSLGKFGLARTGRSFKEDRLAERIAQEYNRGQFVINEIAR